MKDYKWDEWRPLQLCKEWRYTTKEEQKVEYRLTLAFFTGCECLLCEFKGK